MAQPTGIEPAALQRIERIPTLLTDTLPRYVFRALAAGLFREGQAFKDRFRGTLAGKFKTGGQRVGRAFKVYTTGQTLGDLALGIFTRWSAAVIYETGGTITSRDRYLVIPVSPAAYTSAGRIKRSWRDPANPTRFNFRLFEDLRPVKVRGGILLVRDRGVSKKARTGELKRGRGLTKVGRRGVEAVEPVFLLIRSTSRRAVLRFFAEFSDMAGERGERLAAAVERALKTIAAET